MIKKTLYLLATSFMSLNLLAQMNLVPNGSFDQVEKKIKSAGMIEMSTGWTSPHDVKADLFSANSKIDQYMAPENIYGKEDPDEGESYAGIMVYSYKNSKPTTFIQAQLSSPLVQGKVYCVKYLISLADLAKYSTNNIGLHLSKKKLTSQEIDKHTVVPQVMHSQNKVMNEQYTWEPICKMYSAEGGEQFVTIGNFAKSEETQAVKVKRPGGFSKPQQSIGYYYIENVSVVPMDSIREDECICEKVAPGSKMKVVYNQNISEEHRLEDQHIIEFTKIHFSSNSTNLSQEAKVYLDKVVSILKQESTFKIEVIGHTDELEGTRAPATLSEDRAKSVRQYISNKGISTTRVTVKGLKSTQLDNKEGTPAGQSKNRRVEFKVL